MKDLENIKHLYKPVQPTVSIDNNQIAYAEIKATAEVENFVHCYWQLKTTTELTEPFSYQIVSDGCIDIFFEHNMPSQNFVMGFFRKYTEFTIGTKFNYIGIRFLPSAFPLLFNINAKTLSNQSQELEHVLPEFSSWLMNSQIHELTFAPLAKLLNSKLKQVIQDHNFELDSRVYNSVMIILQRKGHLDIEKDLSTGLSPRQLRRVFNYYIGTTPKAFSNVVRFQHILNAMLTTQNLTANKVYFDVGFFDQAHFIKHFKRFYGVTPSEAFR